MRPTRMIIVGVGSCGANYAEYAAWHPDQAQVMGAAEPRAHYRSALAARHGITADRVFSDWQQVVEHPRFVGAVIIATPDALHAEPGLSGSIP